MRGVGETINPSVDRTSSDYKRELRNLVVRQMGYDPQKLDKAKSDKAQEVEKRFQDVYSKITGENIDPADYPKSEGFRKNWNDFAKKFGISWTGDPNGNNTQEPGEIKLESNVSGLYGYRRGEPSVDRFTLGLQVALDYITYVEYPDYAKSLVGDAAAFFSTIKEVDTLPKIEEANLNPAERVAVFRTINELFPLLDELFVRQYGGLRLSRAVEQTKKDYASGRWQNEQGRYLMTNWLVHGNCPGLKSFDDSCSVLPVPQDRLLLNAMIPEGKSPEWWRGVVAAHKEAGLDDDPVLHPNIPIVEVPMEEDNHGLRDGLIWVPLSEHPLFRDICIKIAEKTEEIARINILGYTLRPSLRRSLLLAAEAFRNGTPENWDRALREMMEQKDGPLVIKVTAGTETYKEDNVKFLAYGAVMLRNLSLMEEMLRHKGIVQHLDREAAALDSYDGRDIHSRQLIDVGWTVALSGYMISHETGTAGGWNVPESDVHGIHDIKESVSLLEFFENEPEGRKRIREALLGKRLAGFASTRGLAYEIYLHESGHHAGPERDYRFGKKWGWADEPKADLSQAVEVINLYDRWKASGGREGLNVQESLEILSGRLGRMFFLFGVMPTNEINAIAENGHPVGWGLHIAWLKEKGQIKIRENDGYLDLDLGIDEEKCSDEELLDAVVKKVRCLKELWLKVIDYEARGDVDGYVAFAGEYLRKVPLTYQSYVKSLTKKFGVGRVKLLQYPGGHKT